VGTVAADFKPRDHDMEAAISLNLPLQSIEEVTFEFRDLAAAQTGHVDVVPLWAALVEVFLALHMHEVEFVNQSVPLQQSESAVDSHPIDLGINPAGAPQQLAGVKVLFGGLHYAENGAALASHAQPAGHEFSLQTSWNLGFRQWHGSGPYCNSGSNYSAGVSRKEMRIGC
jgi:hypothetical protein